MLSTLVYTSLLVLAPVVKVAAFAVNNPEFTTCQDVRITWEDTHNPPYDVWVINPESPCDDPYLDLGADHQGTSMTVHTAGLPAGLKVQVSVQDSQGQEAWSEVITVKSGSSDSCVPQELASLVPKSSSASSAASSSASGTTLVVTPTTTATRAASSSAGASVAPIAAAGAAIGQGNGASVAQISTPVVLFGALLGAFFVAL